MTATAAPRVLVLAPDPFGVGGIERATRALMTALSDGRGQPTARLAAVWGGSSGSLAGTVVIEPGMRRGSSKVVSLRRRISYTVRAARYARSARGNIDVIVACHAHLSPVAWLCRRVSDSPYVVWCHGMESWGRLSSAVRFSVGRADHVVCGSNFTARRLRENGVVGESASTSVVRYPLALSIGSATSSDTSGPTVITVARLDAAETYKGVDTLIEAWPSVLHRHSAARLVIVGDGSDRTRLERLAAILDLDNRVTFAGRVDDDELDRLYATADVFALPARTRLRPRPEGEGFGLVFIEAGAHRLPVVGGRGGGVDEAVVDGETGVLVDPQVPAETAAAVVRLLDDRDLARRLGETGRRRAETVYAPEVFAEMVRGLLQQVSRGRRAAA